MAMHISKRGLWIFTALLAMRQVACGSDPLPSGTPENAGGSETEPDASAGSGGTGGSEAGTEGGAPGEGLAGDAGGPGTGGRLSNSGGRGGRGGSGGTQAATAGSGGTNEPVASGGRGEGGELGSAGSNAGGTDGTNPCDGPDACAAPGVSCEGGDRVECTSDDDGCFIAIRTSCGEQACVDGECVDNGTGESCDDLRVIDSSTVLFGENFALEFGDQQDFVGKGCALTSRASAETVMAVNLQAGQTVLLREIGEYLAEADEEDPSIDAILGFLGECSDSAGCLASTRGPDWAGVTYTATQNETVYAFVGSEANPNGRYMVAVEYTESLGRLGLGATVPSIHKGALTEGEWLTYVVELTQAATLYGDLKQDGTGGDLDIRVYDAAGTLKHSALDGDEEFAFALPAGKYRFEISAFKAVTGYTLRVFTDPFTVLPAIDLGDSLGFSSGRIPVGRSRFYLLELNAVGLVRFGVAAEESGDPDLWLYDSGSLLGARRETGLIEAVALTLDQAPAAAVMRVEAHERGGDILLHEVFMELVSPPAEE